MKIANQIPHRFDARLPNLKGCVFIVTYGRSGSTLLQTVLQSIPGAHILGENNNIMLHLWKASRAARGTKGAWGPKGSDRPQHPWYGAQDFRPNDFSKSLVDAFVFNILRPAKDARWIGFKEIRYSAFDEDFGLALDFIASNFKNSYFIFNSRDASSVARSSWWKTRDPGSVRDMVQTMDKRFAAYAKSNPHNTFLNSFENLLENPLFIEPLFNMLGEEFSEERVRSVLNNKLSH